MWEQCFSIRAYEQEFCSIMTGPEGHVPHKEFDQYKEVRLYTDATVIHEMISNQDACIDSAFLHK